MAVPPLLMSSQRPEYNPPEKGFTSSGLRAPNLYLNDPKLSPEIGKEPSPFPSSELPSPFFHPPLYFLSPFPPSLSLPQAYSRSRLDFFRQRCSLRLSWGPLQPEPLTGFPVKGQRQGKLQGPLSTSLERGQMSITAAVIKHAWKPGEGTGCGAGRACFYCSQLET